MNVYKRTVKLLLLAIIFLTGIRCTQPSRLPYDSSFSNDQTRIYGSVNNWPTDTIYFFSLPFHSPFSSFNGFEILSPNNTFSLTFHDIDKPMVLCLTPEKRFVDESIDDFLYEALTDRYYQGYCGKFFTMPLTTYLIEPGMELEIELIKESRYGETKINFLSQNAYSMTYYQSSHDLVQSFDELLTFSESLDQAIIDLKKMSDQYITELDAEKDFISPVLYQYMKAQIQFGAKKELLRYLMLDHFDFTQELFEKDDLKSILHFIDFKKEEIEYSAMISQEFNEFVELYVNFNISLKSRNLEIYRNFDQEKFDFIFNHFSGELRYHYLANNLLYCKNNDYLVPLYLKLIDKYPEGDLNKKLLKQFKDANLSSSGV